MVSVDNDFARFGAKSYAINKITSVEVREQRPHGVGCGMVIAGFATLMFALVGIASPPFLIGAMLLGFLTYKMWQRSKIVDYQLFLITSAAEQQAYVSRDPGEIADLRATIEEAMARSARI